jgi:type I restriction enzyme S subunit
MGEWREYKISDIADVIGGGTPKTSVAEYWNGDIPWLSVIDFNTGKKYVSKTEKRITRLGLEKSSTKLLQTNDIIISARGTVGALAMLDKPMTFNQSCYGMRAKEKITTSDYLFYLLKNTVRQLQQASYGAVFDTITRNTFDETDISLPPLKEQKAIAEVLSSLDDKIDLLHRQNKTLEEMAQTLFRQWFIEEADEGWEVGKLPDEFDFTMGLSPKGETFNENGVGTPMYQGNADFEFRFPKNRVYTTDPKRYAEKFDTLISVRAPVGAQNMAKERCCIGRGVASFRYKADSSFYTYTYFKMMSLMNEIKQFNDSGTVFGSINKTDFQNMEVSIPPINLVVKYQDEVKPLDDKVIQNTKQIKTLENMRDTLLPKLMSGEVRVTL